MSAPPRLHVVTDDEILARRGFAEQAAEVLEMGGAALALHVRGPRTDSRRLYDIAAHLGPAAEETGALLLLNDRVDVAMATNLRAVQLGRRSLKIEDLRALMPWASIGVSCHDDVEVAQARSSGVTWILLGNLYKTESHPGRSGLGPERFEALVKEAGVVPVLAIGGVTPNLIERSLEAGAWGIAVRSGIWDAESPRAAISEYISVLRAKVGETR